MKVTVLEMSLPEKNCERGDRYIDVIINKTDEIAKLSQDMFLHAISDLEKLEIEPLEYQSRELVNDIIEQFILQFENRIVIASIIPDVKIFVDKLRLSQVCENIISNTSKYSPDSDIRIEAVIKDGFLKLRFRDFGSGVMPEEIPFIFDKFFRGKNAKESGKQGSGLGLYISKYILEKMDGQIKAYNCSESGNTGFLVEISLKIL